MPGSYTTPQTRQQGVKLREQAPRPEKFKAEIGQYIDEVKKYKEDQAQIRDREKRQDLEMLKNYDPWSKSSVPKGVSFLSFFFSIFPFFFRTSSPCSSSSFFFPLPLPPSSPPSSSSHSHHHHLKTSPKSLQNKHKVGMETVNKQVEQAVDGAYTQVAFGKPGAGAPIRTSSGKVQAHYHVDPDTQMSNVYRDNLGATAAAYVFLSFSLL